MPWISTISWRIAVDSECTSFLRSERVIRDRIWWAERHSAHHLLPTLILTVLSHFGVEKCQKLVRSRVVSKSSKKHRPWYKRRCPFTTCFPHLKLEPSSCILDPLAPKNPLPIHLLLLSLPKLALFLNHFETRGSTSCARSTTNCSTRPTPSKPMSSIPRARLSSHRTPLLSPPV